MSNSGRREQEMLFIADDDDWVQMKKARRLIQELNTADRADFDQIRYIIQKLFGKSDETTFVNPPFFAITALTSKWEKTALSIITVLFSIMRKLNLVIIV